MLGGGWMLSIAASFRGPYSFDKHWKIGRRFQSCPEQSSRPTITTWFRTTELLMQRFSFALLCHSPFDSAAQGRTCCGIELKRSLSIIHMLPVNIQPPMYNVVETEIAFARLQMESSIASAISDDAFSEARNSNRWVDEMMDDSVGGGSCSLANPGSCASGGESVSSCNTSNEKLESAPPTVNERVETHPNPGQCVSTSKRPRQCLAATSNSNRPAKLRITLVKPFLVYVKQSNVDLLQLQTTEPAGSPGCCNTPPHSRPSASACLHSAPYIEPSEVDEQFSRTESHLRALEDDDWNDPTLVMTLLNSLLRNINETAVMGTDETELNAYQRSICKSISSTKLEIRQLLSSLFPFDAELIEESLLLLS
jgi:hypothetical protein